MKYKRALHLMAVFAPLVSLIIGLQLGRYDPGGILPTAMFLSAVLVANFSNRSGFTLLVAALATVCMVAPEHPQLGIADNTNFSPTLALAITGIWLATALLLWNPKRGHVTIDQLVDALAQAPAGLLILDLAGRIVMANTTIESITGQAHEQIRGKFLKNLVGAEFWATIQSRRSQLYKGESLKLSGSLERPDGTSSLVSGFARLIMSDIGKPRYIIVQVFDESETQDTRRALAQADSRFRNIIELSGELILMVNQHGRITRANSCAAQAFGRTEAELLNCSVLDFIKTDNRKKFVDVLKASMNNPDQTQHLEQLQLNDRGRGQQRDDEEIVVDARLVGLPSAEGISGTIISCRVITEHVASIKELRASEARFSRIFHSSPDAILIVRQSDSTILDFNAGFSRLLGYTREQAIGQRESDLSLWTDEAERERIFSILSSQQECTDVETRLLTVSGGLVHVEISLRYIEIDGELCVLCIGRDIAKRVLAESALKESDEKFARVFSESPDGIVILSQADATIVDINELFVESSGYLREELVGKTIQELNVFADKQMFKKAAMTLASEGHLSNQEMVLRTKSGEHIPVLTSATLLDFGKEPCILCITKDVRELRNTEEQLLRSEDRFRGTFENAPIGIVLVDLDGQIFQVNHFAAELLSYEVESMQELHISRLLPSDERNNLKEAMADLVTGKESISREERKMLCKDGHEIWTNFHIVVQRSPEDEAMYCIIQIGDITEMKTSQRRMEQMAFFDTLTNLANRRLFHDRLAHATEHCVRTNRVAALLYLDLDQFKRVNDSLGHEVGDMLLKEVAGRLTKCVRKEDTVGRPGGDEFTILLYDVSSPTDASIVAENILKELRRPVSISGHQLIVTTSIGIVTIPDDGVDPNMLMRNADLAMYKAKERGRNTYQFYSDEMNTDAAKRLRTEYELSRALDFQEFELFYQPKVRLNDQRVVGVESLIRWQHPERGLLSPIEFIEVAEEMGVIVDIGNWVIEEACKACCVLSEANGAPITVAINISPRQFHDPHLVQTIRRCLRETKLSADSIELEITETMLVLDVEAASEIIRRLTEIGVRIAIDDFGTGYSSLNYLKKFPIDTVKVDRCFVMDIPDSSEDMAITAAVIAMAHGLNMSVVAEGVETSEQMDFLIEHKCEYAQGFLFSKALPLNEIISMLESDCGENGSRATAIREVQKS
ncbi:MAG: PAS domain S-box protein [Gammaproteobacteria bacterium]|nr:PAS domain S-box protein [Gammaproteobacteria bacterium]